MLKRPWATECSGDSNISSPATLSGTPVQLLVNVNIYRSRGSNSMHLGFQKLLIRADSRATVTQITTCRTLKQMVCSSRGPEQETEATVHTDSHWTIEERKRSDLMSLDFCCHFQMVGSEFGVINMKAWIHPALYQWFRLVS